MNKSKINYDKKQDILYIVIREAEEDHFVEVAEGVTVEFDDADQPIGIEIFNASKVLLPVIGRDSLSTATA